MRVKLKALLAVMMTMLLVVTALTGCTGNKQGNSGALVTIVIGTHAQQEDDPYWVDEITGEPTMNPQYLRAAEKALGIVEEKLNVKVTWSQYSSDLQQLLLQTVLAGDPYCDLAVLWNGVQGNIMNQNVLQAMDPYMDDVFFGEDDEDKKWIPIGKTFGSYYLMNRDLLFVNTWPICYNINYIEAAGLEDPSEVYLRGDWTWSYFRTYLEKLKAWCANQKSPKNTDVAPFNTNYSYTVLMAIASNGAAVYDGAEMSFDSQNAKDAIAYMDEMINSDLITCSTVNERSIDSGWLTGTNAFINGETVFTNVARWQMDNAGIALSERGQSMGIIPFPRPDSLKPGDPQYRILSAAADSVGLMKGIDPDRSKLALEAYATYKSEYYKAYGDASSIAEYRSKMASAEAVAFGIDVFHPKYGDNNLKIFEEMGLTPVNDYSEAIGVFWTWTGIAGKAIYGRDGSPKYDIAANQYRNQVYDKLQNMEKALSNKNAVDEIKPGISRKTSGPLAFPAGTKLSSINWSELFSANDNVDGDYELRMKDGKVQLRKFVDDNALDEDGNDIPKDKWTDGRFSVDASAVDFNTTGHYEGAIVVKVKDSSGNEAEATYDAFVYDKKNKTAPTLKLKEELPSIGVGTDTATVNWGNDFVESAADVNDIDIKSRVSARVDELDVTVPGKYPVEIYVTDFAGNKTSLLIELEVK